MYVMRRIQFCFILLMLASQWMFAQELIVKSVIMHPKDNSALINPCVDFNGATCALVRVVTDNLIGLEFTNKGQYVKQTSKTGIYDIYMPPMSKRLSFGHKDYLAGQIEFHDFGYKGLKEGKTYIVRIETPSSEGKVVLKVQPSTASVIFDGQIAKVQENGIYEFSVSPSTYKYSVESPNFISFHGIIQVNKSEVKTIPLSLKPIVHPVNIECNVDDAFVYIDGIDYGKVGLKNIPQGLHRVRVSKEKYLDWEEEINVDSLVTSLSCFLEKNKNVKEIHAVPVTIIARSMKIYKNNKEIKEWKNGKSVIMFMPGKYFISNDDGVGKEINVIDEPFTIHL